MTAKKVPPDPAGAPHFKDVDAPEPSLTPPGEIGDVCVHLRPRIARIAGTLLRDTQDADDATQIALLEILKGAPGFRGEGSFEGWADRIAVRTILRIARERRVRSLRVDAIEPDALAAATSGSSLRDALPRELRVYLDELPETRRTALVLRHALDYGIQEIAELTGVSANTVKDRLLAARDQVRKAVRRDLSVGVRRRS